MPEEGVGVTIRRRTLLNQTVGVLGAATLATSSAGAEKLGKRRFVGKSYDPVTDKEQGDATATLELTENGLTGTLKLAGFVVPVGEDEPLEDVDSHPTASRYYFESRRPEHVVQEDGEDLHLKGYLETDGDTATGTLTRPSPGYGKIAFSLGATDRGFTKEAIGSALHPERFRGQVPGFDQIQIPATGIPRDNSIRNVSRMASSEETSTSDAKGEDLSESVTTDSVTTNADGGDVGILNRTSMEGGITHTLPDRCDDDFVNMTWDYEFSTSAKVRYDSSGNVESDYDEIIQSSQKPWHMDGFFEEIPDSLLMPCDQKSGFPHQAGVEAFIEHGPNNSNFNTELNNPRPDGQNNDTSPDDDMIGLVLDLVNSVTGPLGGVASIIVEYSLNGDAMTSDDVQKNQDGDQTQWHWDLPLTGLNEDSPGSDYFPDTTDNTAGVAIQVENPAGDGLTPELETRGGFQWSYYEYLGTDCPCESFNTTLKTTTDLSTWLDCEYTSINDPDS